MGKMIYLLSSKFMLHFQFLPMSIRSVLFSHSSGAIFTVPKSPIVSTDNRIPLIRIKCILFQFG